LDAQNISLTNFDAAKNAGSYADDFTAAPFKYLKNKYG
jgi:hypothetical protein